jgi:hypothetical protein
MSYYFSKLYDKAQTEEAKEAINNEWREYYKDFKDTYKQLKK